MPIETYQQKTTLYGNKPARAPGKFNIAIAAGKGGVGKSTLSTNLALALRVKGYRVGLMDADIYGPSLRRMIREDRLPYEREGKLEPALSQGIELISIAHFRQEGEASAFRAPIASQIIEQFLYQVNWRDLDFFLVDLPPGTGDIALTLAQKGILNTSLLISTPQAVATQDVNKCIDLFEMAKVPILGLIENMAYFLIDQKKIYPFGEGEVDRLAKTRHYDVLATLPLCPQIAQACDEGIPFVLAYPEHELTKLFFKLADRVIEAYTLSIKNINPSKPTLEEESTCKTLP